MRAQCVYNKFFVINIDVIRNSSDQPLRALGGKYCIVFSVHYAFFQF